MKLLGKLPHDMADKICKYNNLVEQQLRIVSKLRLQQLCELSGLNSNSLHNIKYNSYNKPYFSGDMQFSFSHSKNMAVVALSGQQACGIDIEFIDIHQKHLPLEILHELDRERIRLSKNPQYEYYRFWTRREALAKAIGKGIFFNETIAVYNDTIEWEQTNYFFKDIYLDSQFVATLCSHNQNPELEIRIYKNEIWN